MLGFNMIRLTFFHIKQNQTKSNTNIKNRYNITYIIGHFRLSALFVASSTSNYHINYLFNMHHVFSVFFSTLNYNLYCIEYVLNLHNNLPRHISKISLFVANSTSNTSNAYNTEVETDMSNPAKNGLILKLQLRVL